MSSTAGRDYSKARDAAEVPGIARRNAETMGERRRTDPEIVCADESTLAAERHPRLCMHASDRLGDRDWIEASENVLDERAPPGASRPSRPIDAV